MLDKIVYIICIIVLSILSIRIVYEYRFSIRQQDIVKIILQFLTSVNVNFEDLQVYYYNDFIRYKIIAQAYKKLDQSRNILLYLLPYKHIFEIDYDHCYIDVQYNNIYRNNMIFIPQANILNFNNGYNQNINVSLLQNIIINYKNNNTAKNIIKYIQNIVLHVDIAIYNGIYTKWNDCLTFMLEQISIRMNKIWPYASSFSCYREYNNDIKPYIIIAEYANHVNIDHQLLSILNRAGIYLILMTNKIINNNIFHVSLIEHEWPNRFSFYKHNYHTYLYGNFNEE